MFYSFSNIIVMMLMMTMNFYVEFAIAIGLGLGYLVTKYIPFSDNTYLLLK
jgi:hypothetical protein